MDLTVGFVRGSHGLTGEVRIESASGRYEHIAALKEVTLVQKGNSAKYDLGEINFTPGNS